MSSIHLCFGGPAVRLKTHNRDHTFEMSPRLGPVRLMADGETPARNHWGPKSAFWGVFEKWDEQGRVVDEHGRGVIR